MTAAQYLTVVQDAQRKALGLLRTSDGRLGEKGHKCKPPKTAGPLWRCSRCKRRRRPATVNPYRDRAGHKTELAQRLRAEHDKAAA